MAIPMNMPTKPGLERVIVKNASANLARLIGSGIVALLLPPFLVRTLAKETYGTWALLMQLTLYVSYFDLGVQTAVARFVAHSDELNDSEQRDGTVSTAFVILGVSGLLGCLLIIALSCWLPALFPQMPHTLQQPAQFALALMGISLAAGLPVSAISALFVGMQRSEIPSFIAIANKMIMALLIVIAVSRQTGLIAMAGAVAIANLMAYLATYAAWRLWAEKVRIGIRLVSRKWAHQIGKYSAGLLVWMFGMLLVTGLDLTIVGVFDYRATAYYAVAATLTNFLAQAQGAMIVALLPASSALGARGDSERLGGLLVRSTRYGMLILLAMALPLIVGAQFVLRIWTGPDYAQHSTAILQLLLLANI